MTITADMFAAYLKCPTKCFLLAHGACGSGNEYADWVRSESERYRTESLQQITARTPPVDFVTGMNATADDLKTAKWRIATDVAAHSQDLESHIHVLERIPPGGRGRSAQYVPIRFVFRNKLTKDDKLLAAYDALVWSEMSGRPVAIVRIIHGDARTTLNVKTAGLVAQVRKRTEQIKPLLAANSTPDLILHRHCGECEYQTLCREKAVEKDDLSLLAGMPEKERNKLHSKGIFTVTQLSYTFRPRRRPKKLRDKREKYHHSLKALAIREKKIHIVGSLELKIEGTPVYLDVEGIPDRDFYYLIGLRIGNGDAAVQHSLWVETTEDEKRIWEKFLAVLDQIASPVIVHYGSYERVFLKAMRARYGGPSQESATARALEATVNLLSAIYGHIYFPTCSNSLKEIAGYLGFAWPDPSVGGANSIARRCAWESSRAPSAQHDLITYNTADCVALATILSTVAHLRRPDGTTSNSDESAANAVNVDTMEARPTMWPRFTSPIAAFDEINRAARWDYQRDRIYLRTDGCIRRQCLAKKMSPRAPIVNKAVEYRVSPICQRCDRRGSVSHYASRVLYDLGFGRWSVKRWIVRYTFCVYYCRKCRCTFGVPEAFLPGSKYGRDLANYVTYNLIELCIPQRVATQSLNRLFGYHLSEKVVHCFKTRLATFYEETRHLILQRMLVGPVILADETQIGIKGKRTYVWVFTSLHDVVYFHSETREGETVQNVLSGFKGVLVSDFYAPYDSIACPQQKCLIHLVRDLNDELLSRSYDEELRALVMDFAELLRPMIATVDHRGLKRHFLRKHVAQVDRFFRRMEKSHPASEAALRCKTRLEKNRDKLFTFLEHDGVPWNNNNAEHAIKAFARLRRVIEGLSTMKGIDEYLVLLSVCQTCKYQGLDFLDFLRSGQKDIEAYAQSKRRPRCYVQSSAANDGNTSD